MFEIEGKSGSQDDPKSVSSDVTKSATHDLEQFQEQIKRLENENKVLQGRIRGYKTLGDLLQEAKQQNKKLSEDKIRLKQKLETCTTSTKHDVMDITGYSLDPEFATQSMTISELTKPELIWKSIATGIDTKTDIQKEAVDPPIMARSLGDSTHDNNQAADAEEACRGSIREVIPMQESLADFQNDLSRIEGGTAEEKVVNTDHNLELDSDRYDEPEYEKIRRPSASKLVSMSEVTSSMSVISSGPDDKFNFPSLSSGIGNRGPDVRPKTYAIEPTVIMLPPTCGADTELSAHILNMLQVHGKDEKPELAAQFRKMSDDITKLEDDRNKFKNLAYTFAQENQKLKTASTMEVQQLKNQTFELRNENNRLLERVKRLEHDRDHLPVNAESLSSQTDVVGWMKVTKPEKDVMESELFQQGAEQTSPREHDALMANIQSLRKQNKELKEANHNWNVRWQELTGQWEVKVKGMKEQVGSYKNEVEELKKKVKSQEENSERIVQNLKIVSHEEETAKEEALTKLHQLTNQNRGLQDKLGEQECRIEAVIRDKHNLEAELEVLKARRHEGVLGEQFAARQNTSDLITENMVLKQQMQVFKEDFEKERHDRAAAQSVRDDLQSTLDKVKHDKDSLSRKNRILDQRLKSHEVTLQQALQRTESLDSQIRDLQNQKRQLENQRIPAQFQSPVMEPGYAQRYQNVPVIPNQAMPPYTHGQMGAAGYMAPAQMPGFNQPYINAAPFQPYAVPGQPMMAASPQPQQAQPPAQWTCQECTYTNIPSRTVCEMCGRIRRTNPSAPVITMASEPVLMSRDVVHRPPLSRGEDVPDENADLVVDSEGCY